MQILIPIDFSETSARMLRFAFGLNRHFFARLQVLHLFDIPITAGDDGEVYLRNYEAYRKGYEDQVWAFVQEHKGEYHYDTEVFATSGGHYQGIISFAQNHPPDLIIVGHKGAGKAARWMFGSVARYLLTHPPVPVLSIPGQLPESADSGFRKILLATDLSAPLSEGQSVFLKDFSQRQQAALGLLHIRVSGEIPAPGEDQIIASFTNSLGIPLQQRALGKDEAVAEAILFYMHTHGYDLLVTIPHAHLWLDRWLIGSQTRNLEAIGDIAILALPKH